jgi:tetratricopeptide (TPR) repeat protein
LDALARGASVGRYVVLDRIGAGGMGVVYAAYDPELDRRVALKLLRPDRFAGDADRLRLLREAQALARLADPHVVAVYDAGTFGDRVFVAMELVEGETLRQWLLAAPRTWREVLARFLPAGRGLAAAHASGLVHRDFKPENVLLGRDGRVRVVDFGLAKAVGNIEEMATGTAVAEAGDGLAAPLTDWGAVLGTPAYMAPEQLRGIAADARSDQFSFCVALYEALYSERPFAGTVLREAPAGTKVPGWLRTVLLRGLQVDPEKRYPAMDDLLRDLEHDREAARRRWLLAAAVVLVTGAVFSSLGYFQARRARLCGGGEEKVASVWNDGRRQAIHAAFLASGAPVAVIALKTVDQTLGRYTAEWVGMRREACEATRLQGDQSEDLLDRRMFCLDQELQHTAATVNLLARADRGVVEKSFSIIGDLPSLQACAVAAALTTRVPPPKDPVLRGKVGLARARMAEAQALIAAGKYPEAGPKAAEAAEMAGRLGYAPLQAEALFQKGRLLDLKNDHRGAETAFFDAFVAAQAAGHPEIAARSASMLSWIVGFEQPRIEEGNRWDRLSEAIADGSRLSARIRAGLLLQRASLLANQHRFQEAVDVSLRAIPLAARGLGSEGIDFASLETNLGEYYNQLGQEEEALRHVHHGLEIRRKIFSPDHPHFAGTYTTLGNIYVNMGRYPEAVAAYQRAYETARNSYGPAHWRTLGALDCLGVAHRHLGQYAEALRCSRQALALFTDGFGPEHPYVAMCLNNIGATSRLQGRPADALASHQRALAIQEKALGANDPELVESLVGVARTLPELGRATEAVAAAERALALLRGRPVNRTEIDKASFALAAALWESGGDRVRAAELARQALQSLAAAHHADEAGEIEAWLARHRLPERKSLG